LNCKPAANALGLALEEAQQLVTPKRRKAQSLVFPSFKTKKYYQTFFLSTLFFHLVIQRLPHLSATPRLPSCPSMVAAQATCACLLTASCSEPAGLRWWHCHLCSRSFHTKNDAAKGAFRWFSPAPVDNDNFG
jgi:hypothetical protein